LRLAASEPGVIATSGASCTTASSLLNRSDSAACLSIEAGTHIDQIWASMSRHRIEPASAPNGGSRATVATSDCHHT
jgi:hypothetical protein